MNIRNFYIVAIVFFYISIPVAFSIDKVIFFVKGHDKELIFEKKNTYNDPNKVKQYYDAYKKASGLIVLSSRLILLLWIAILIFSFVMIKKGVSVPFKLEIITSSVSSILVLITVVPILIFGKGWPPRFF